MNIDPMLLWFCLPIILFGGFFIYQFWTKGFTGAFFGGKVKRTLGEIEMVQHGLLTGRIKVHEIESSGGDQMIGIEVIKGAGMTALLFHQRDIESLINILTKTKQ